MGKKGINQQEKLAKANASSSARAAQSLLGSNATTGFIGFGAFATSAPAPPVQEAAAAPTQTTSFTFYDGDDTDLSLALKMLGKRDAQTKTKALATIKDTIIPSRKPVDLRPAIGHYCYLYGKLMLDNDRRVRQMANDVLGAFIDRMKKGTIFHVHMLLLLPTWYILGMHDLHVDTARGATRAFHTLVPEEADRTALLTTHVELLISNIKAYLEATVDSLSDRALCTADEAEERYERCVTSALVSASSLIASIPVEPNTATWTELLGHMGKLSTLTSKSVTFSRASIRHATYQLLLSATTSAPTLLQSAVEPKVVLGVVGEKFPANISTVWTLVLSYLDAVPKENLPWSSLQGNILPKVLTAIKHAFYGSTSAMANILPFVSQVPFDIISPVYTDLLSAFWKGLESPNVLHGQTPVVQAFTECLLAVSTIFPSSVAASIDDDTAYVAQFKDVVSTAWSKALATVSTLPDRTFQVFCREMTALLPRLTAFQQRTSTSTIAMHAISLLQASLEDVLLRGIQDGPMQDARMLTVLQTAKNTYEGALNDTLVELCRRLAQVLLTKGQLSRRGLEWIGHLLELIGWNTLFPDPMAAIASYHRAIAPAFEADKRAFFVVWKHFAPHAPDVLWTQLLQVWDRDDVAEWKKSALTPLKSLESWLQGGSAANLGVHETIWKSHWFDSRVLLILNAPGDASWTDADDSFFSACWGASQPLVSPTTIRQVVAWCHKNKDSPKCWSLLRSLLPLLVTINTNEIWGDVVDLVDAVVSAIPRHSEAMSLWRDVVQPSFQTWPATYTSMVEGNWLDLLRQFLEDEASCTASQWAVLCGEFITSRGGKEARHPWHALPLSRVSGTYRELECMAELCHWQSGKLIHDAYLTSLTPVEILPWFVLDVGFSLTWYVVDTTDPTVLSEHVGAWIEPYLMLADLWESLGDTAHLPQMLLHLVAKYQAKDDASDVTAWFSAIMSAHMDQKVPPAEETPLQLYIWMLQIGLDYVSTEVLVSVLDEWASQVDATPLVCAALPRLVQCAIEGNSKDTIQPLVEPLLELETRALDVASLSRLAHLLPLVDDAFISSIISRIPSFVKSPPSILLLSDWLDLADFVLAVLDSPFVETSAENATSVFHAVGQLLLHAISAKHDISEVVGLRLHSTAVQTPEDLVKVHPLFMRGRFVLLKLMQAMARHGQDHSTIELARHHREALTLVALRSIVDGLHLKPTFHVAFAAHTPTVAASWATIVHTHDVYQAFTTSLIGLHHVLEFVQDDAVGSTLLQLSQGRDMLWHALSETLTHPTLQAGIYHVLRLTSLVVAIDNVKDLVDVDGQEDAMDTAIADLVITPGLHQALQQHLVESTSAPLKLLLVWDLYLRMFPETSNPLVTSALGAFVGRQKLLTPLLTLCGHVLQSSKVQLGSNEAVEGAFPALDGLDREIAVAPLAAAVFYRTVVKLPTMVRLWWNDECSRSARSWVSKFCEELVSPLMLNEEIQSIQAASAEQSLWDPDEMTVRGSKVSREITTTYLKDECSLEMVIRVPPSYPLRTVEVECTKRIGISEERWRRWILQILKVTTSQDGSLLDAVLLWKSNVDKEFDGVEPCPICFSILNPKTMGLPNLPCRTCNNKYHNSCLYKWFNQSSKNKCPICQQPFS
ncbi:unnamed protein product [Aphanomyces euteiches]|uniref:E3 ubiquitin-protein ligase listerin n=1 Tax=Aphanomyces euteiches TaxID=100861 RepID=A0A6G0WLG8_9STRA|nr:hypothetical protein Ae201684_013952 [Aphanomyces euteiches]KAH9082840.1 hypothetical protein Ae201684P_013745 [Aphanomyces euteiches]KAH9145977.1 hypothetical protein AeRB84_010148 [Aphanomyces euteiches]